MSDNHSSVALPWWVLLIATACALLLAAGAVLAFVRPAMLAGPGQQMNSAVHVYAGYLISRNLAIAALLLGAAIHRARRALSILMALAALVQFLDAGMNALEERWALIPGVLLLGIMLSIGAKRIGFSQAFKSTA